MATETAIEVIGVLVIALVFAFHFTRVRVNAALKKQGRDNELIVTWLRMRVSHLANIVDMLIERCIPPDERNEIEIKLDHELEIYRVITHRYTLAELETLAFEIGIKWDNVPGTTLDTRAISLIQLAAQMGKLALLLSIIKRDRQI